MADLVRWVTLPLEPAAVYRRGDEVDLGRVELRSNGKWWAWGLSPADPGVTNVLRMDFKTKQGAQRWVEMQALEWELARG